MPDNVLCGVIPKRCGVVGLACSPVGACLGGWALRLDLLVALRGPSNAQQPQEV